MRDNEPILSLVVIRSANIDRAAEFYGAVGLTLTKDAHGGGPDHFTGIIGASVFEIYPAQNQNDSTIRTRLGFKVPSVRKSVEAIRKIGGAILHDAAQTAYGYSATIQDFDGHKIELYEMS